MSEKLMENVQAASELHRFFDNVGSRLPSVTLLSLGIASERGAPKGINKCGC
jgi:hypothetical protein